MLLVCSLIDKFLSAYFRFARKKNLATICSALQSLGLDATVNERDDIVLGGTKVRVYPTSILTSLNA
jgi:lipoate-protein ligase A